MKIEYVNVGREVYCGFIETREAETIDGEVFPAGDYVMSFAYGRNRREAFKIAKAGYQG